MKAQYTFNYDYVTQKAFPYGQYDPQTGTYSDPHQRSEFLLAPHAEQQPVSGMENRPFYPLFHHGLPISERRHEDGPGLYGTVCFHPSPKAETICLERRTGNQIQYKKQLPMELRRLRFYNSLNTDGPVIFKKDGLTGILQKAFDDILANNPKAPKLTVQGDELNQIYFPGNFDTPTYASRLSTNRPTITFLSKGFPSPPVSAWITRKRTWTIIQQ